MNITHGPRQIERDADVDDHPPGIARFGGEEFLVLVQEVGDGSPTIVADVAERTRQRVSEMRVQAPTPDGPLTVAPLTASVGAVALTDQNRRGVQLADLVQTADDAVYAAKTAGRNRVCIRTIVGTIGRDEADRTDS